MFPRGQVATHSRENTMLAKPNRLVKQKDFEKVFKQGRAYYSKLIGIRSLANQFRLNRFGIIISTKVSKKATERNRLKRQIRQALRELNKKLIVGFDVAIIVFPSLLDQDYSVIKTGLEENFIRLKLLKQPAQSRDR